MTGSGKDAIRRGPAALHSEAKRQASRLFPVLLGASLVLAGCDAAEDTAVATADQAATAAAEFRQTAYRVRADFAAPLNADSGWAADSNTPAVVRADHPFRLRLEVEAPEDAAAQQFQLEFRRNEGNWEPLAAEDFPYPVKELALNFSREQDTSPAETWNLIAGDASALVWQQEGDSGFLRMTAHKGPLLALAQYHTHWEPIEFKAVMRLPESSTAGILFGYRDPDNHYRLELEGGGALRVVQRRNGSEAVVQSEDVGVKTGQWLEVAVDWEGSEVSVAYEWDPYIQGPEFTWDLGETIDESPAGLYLPANSAADLRLLEVSGATHTPRASIVSSSAFAHGDETTNLLPGSELPFAAGAGINYADTSPSWSASGNHSEWEFPIVVRYFSDHANINETGDTFEFRMTGSDGEPLASAHLARVTLEVPEGHLGGTFVETPTRIGPWEAENGDLYFIMEPSETDNVMMMVKSTDGGISWLEVDGANRPGTGDLEGVGSVHVDGSIHILHQTSDHVFYHRFRTADSAEPDSWEIRDERLASPVEPPVQVADIAVRSDGSVVGVYGNLHKILYRVRSPDGEWSEETVVDPDDDRDLSGPVLVRGRDDVVHLAYTGLDGTAWYRSILPNGDLTPRQAVAAGLGTEVQDAGGILPLVYLTDSDAVSIIYRLDNGELWERRAGGDGKLTEAVRVTDRAVVRNAADAEQVGADAIAYGADVHVLFIEEGTNRLFHTWRDGDGGWSEPSLEVDGETVLWVRGMAIKQSAEGAVYGYVYDGGSFGGSGMNRYAEVPLTAR